MGIMFLAREARAKATWRKPSDRPRFSKAIALYRETHVLLDDLAEAVADGTRKRIHGIRRRGAPAHRRRLRHAQAAHTAAEDLLEIVMRRYERTSTLLTSNRPVDDWGKLLGDVAAVSAMLDRLLHHGHVLKCGPRTWRTKTAPAS
jgi:hypothetical protein